MAKSGKRVASLARPAKFHTLARIIHEVRPSVPEGLKCAREIMIQKQRVFEATK